MASQMQTITKIRAASALLNWATDDVRVALSTSATMPSTDGSVYLSSMTNECTGGNYVRKQLAGKAVSEDATNHRAKLLADNTTWTALNAGTIATVWVYLYNVSDAAALVLGVLDPADLVTNGGDVTLKWNGGSSAGEVFTI
jgi:hypothetical protein